MVKEYMRAVRFYEPGVLRFEEVEVPEIGPGEILVENKVTLTCGTDLKMYRRGHPYAKPPLIIGHEFAGVVVKAGDDVERFREGMRVVAANSAPCNECFYCKRGKHNLCENLEDAIIGFTSPGAYAEYVKVPERIVKMNTHVIPDDVTFREAALLEPLACVVHGVELADIQYGDKVVVIGAGPIGLMHLQLAKKRGCGAAIVTDLSDERLQVAKELGADFIVNADKEDQVEKIRELTDGRGADVVIEAAGLPETWMKALTITRKAGTTLLFGGCKSGTQVTFDTHHIHYGELTIIGAFHHTPLSVERALALIASKAIDVKKLITHEVALKDVEAALHMMAEGKAVKVAVRP
ncbi:MAG: zinc-binding dehydrogenase [Candidatus Bathyarchaeia archaeon]